MDGLATSSSFLDDFPGIVAHASFSFIQWHLNFVAFLYCELILSQHVLACKMLFITILAVFRATIISLDDGVVAFLPSTFQVLPGTVP